MLTFGAEGARVEIEGADRDAVYILFSDLREYMTEEVTIALSHVREMSQLVLGILIMAFMTWFTVYANSRSHDVAIAKRNALIALHAKDDTAKLDYLIAQGLQQSELKVPMPALILGLVLMALLLFDVPEQVLRYASPTNVFLFGAQKVRYDKRRQILGKIFWAVVIGGAVSLVAGLAATKFTISR